jgi:hypothetical protein
MARSVRGLIGRGKGISRRAVTISGEVSERQWTVFKSRLKNLAERYGLAVTPVVKTKKKRSSKK